ncbi:type III-B CRISPR module RAMP protein Cmr4 [Thermococcus sp. Bubb.Bath]|uniref:type III-B CRISPR module RAMP protein Cmr4 n=1 Tax=Thermococcus sp. Bubb.Bath TaxID=1638242 RepID=UPI00143B8878|nr:type III-B CRISPR module RAMP protein Cmr4 [Thermococcus sp. Bubb.Bath]NJF24410.1 type III-B CRISPR module RAMP protein Cmr4 [Thermococcus sp. Bubb.Bath]
MYGKKLVLGIYTMTPLHAGSGSEVSVIDLPIQRERHTGFPVIWGQSLKGALRSAFRELKEDGELESVIFGPDPNANTAPGHAGAVAVGDAKVLLFPVRSAKGVFAYITSPLVLGRFKRDMELTGREFKASIPTLEAGKAVVHNNSSLLIGKNVVLEEISLTTDDPRDLSGLANVISQVVPIEKDELLKRLAIVPDDVFSAFVKLSTEVVARVAIDTNTGTVKKGGLWYEEFLPRDTVMYSVVAVAKPRKKESNVTVEEVEEALVKAFNGKFLQLGGDETVGKGFVKITLG